MVLLRTVHLHDKSLVRDVAEEMMGNVAVIGSGAWGTALALQAVRMGHHVRMWAHETEVVRDIQENAANSLYLPGVSLPSQISATTDPGDAVSSVDFVIFVPPSKYLRHVAGAVRDAIPERATLLVASKGIEETSLQLMSQVIQEALPAIPPERLCFLAGPSFAREVALGLPTDTVAASGSRGAAHAVQQAFHSPQFRVYTSADPVGAEIGGALKNVIAIAIGAADGLKSGSNARAALITRGLAEITRLGVALGANPLTFLGLAGVGDLVLTCTGELSRNRALGLKVAEGANPSVFLAGQRTVAEGFYTSHAASKLAHSLNVDMPITEQVYQVLHHGRPLTDAMHQLMARETKDELLGIVTSVS